MQLLHKYKATQRCDAPKVWAGWDTGGGGHSTAKGEKKKKKRKLSQQNKVTTTRVSVCLFLSALVLYVMVSHNDLNLKLNECFFFLHDEKQAWARVYRQQKVMEEGGGRGGNTNRK